MRILKPSPHRRSRQSGTSIYATSIMLVMVIPMMGLAIDGSLLYVVKCQLQGAVDGAALAAAKALARGSDDNAQIASARTAAATYVNLNFPSGYFFTQTTALLAPNTDVTIDLTVANQRTVSVLAHAIEPALFMRWLNFATTTVNASASTVRKDINIVLVLDRSGSMAASSSCAPMKQAAINFVTNFAPNRDFVGLISFSTSTQIQVPLTKDFQVNGVGVSGAVDFATAINGIVCAGSTSTAAGLWKAYDQLVNLNQTAALNFITLFTDGEPTGIDANMPLTTTSPCTASNVIVSGDPVPTGLPSNFTGRYLTGMYATFTNNSNFIGLAKHDTGPNSDGTPNIINSDQVVADKSANCAFAIGWNAAWTVRTDFQGIPTADIYGNSTVTSYQSVTTVTPAPGQTYVDISIPNGTPNGIPLATNAADDAARRIRLHTSIPAYGRGLPGVIIDSIGLGNASVPLPADGVFLSRVSNDPRSPIYDSTYPTGLFVYVANSTDLGNAFQQIASEILRLSR